MRKNIKNFWFYYLLFILIPIGTLVWSLFDKDNVINIVSIGSSVFLAVVALFQSARYKQLSDSTEDKFMSLQEDIKNISQQIYVLADLKEVPSINVKSRNAIYPKNKITQQIYGKLFGDEKIELVYGSGYKEEYDNANTNAAVYIENIGRNIISKIKLNKVEYLMYYQSEGKIKRVVVNYSNNNIITTSINYGDTVAFGVVEPFTTCDAYVRIDQKYYFEIETDIHNSYEIVMGNSLTRSDKNIANFSEFKCSNAELIAKPIKKQGENNG